MDLLVTGMNCHHGNKYSNFTNSCDSHHHRNGSSLRTVRRKRFVGKLLCEKLAEKACAITADLCKGKVCSTHLSLDSKRFRASSSRKLGREQKIKSNDGGGGGKRRSAPLIYTPLTPPLKYS